MNILDDDLKRLNFEDIVFVILIVITIMNIYANQLQKKYIKDKDISSQIEANKIYLFVLVVGLILYFYFLYRNYHSYKNASDEDKELFIYKVLGSSFIVAGTICLIYFQVNDPNFIGSPSI